MKRDPDWPGLAEGCFDPLVIPCARNRSLDRSSNKIVCGEHIQQPVYMLWSQLLKLVSQFPPMGEAPGSLATHVKIILTDDLLEGADDWHMVLLRAKSKNQLDQDSSPLPSKNCCCSYMSKTVLVSEIII